MAAPTDVTGLVAWYKGESGRYDSVAAGSLVTVDGNAIARWEDQSGSGNHATQATAGNRPKKLGSTVVSQYGKNEYFDLPALSIVSRAVSVFFIVKLNSTRQTMVEPGGQIQYHTLCLLNAGGINFNLDGTTGIVGVYHSGGALVPTALSPTSTSMIGFASGAAKTKAYSNDDVSADMGLVSSATASGGSILGYTGFSFPSGMIALDICIYNKELSAAEATTLRTYAASRGAITVSASDRRWIFDGDSRTAGAFAALNQGWVNQLADVGTPIRYNVAESGMTLATIVSQRAARVTPLYNGGQVNTLFLGAGINDIVAGATGAAVYGNIQTYGTAAKGTGFKMIVRTEVPWSTQSGGQPAATAAFNSSLTADFGIGVVPSYADGIMDLAADPTIGTLASTSDTTLYADGIHWTALGCATVAKYPPPFLAASGFTVSGPASGAPAAASTTFTVTIASGGEFRGQMKVRLAASEGTITATAASGTITGNGTGTVTVTPAAGATAFTFLYTPGTAGSKTITHTNAQGWTNPAATSYTAVATLTSPTLTFASVSTATLTANWTAATGGTAPINYVLKRALHGGSLVQVYAGTATTFADTGLSPSTQYDYEVFVTDSAGSPQTSNSGVQSVTTAAAASTRRKQTILIFRRRPRRRR